MSLIINTVNYADGSAEHMPSLAATDAALRHQQATAFVGFSDPSAGDLAQLPASFGIHKLAIEDSAHGHQRAKLERYADMLYLVLRPAVYLDREEEIRMGELHLFVGPQFVVFAVRDYLKSSAATIESFQRVYDSLPRPFSSLQVLHSILDTVVDEYFPVLAGLENDVDEIEDALFEPGGEVRGISQRIYELLKSVADFQRAAKPLVNMLTTVMNRVRDRSEAIEFGPEAAEAATGYTREELLEVNRQFRDVYDHCVHVNERLDVLRSSLQNALRVNDTIVAQRQNDDMKRISAWAAMLVAPTIIGSIYGMNFEVMPELGFTWGYPAALGLMVLVPLVLWVVFKKKGWL